jgi:hypothetical protein
LTEAPTDSRKDPDIREKFENLLNRISSDYASDHQTIETTKKVLQAAISDALLSKKTAILDAENLKSEYLELIKGYLEVFDKKWSEKAALLDKSVSIFQNEATHYHEAYLKHVEMAEKLNQTILSYHDKDEQLRSQYNKMVHALNSRRHLKMD